MLWIFGDSFAGNYCLLKDESRKEKEFPYLEYTWQYLLAEKYKHDFKLKGLGGACNQDTFKVITKYLHQIVPGDIVITILTSPNRQLEVTEEKYSFSGLKREYTSILYNDDPPEGHPIITSHLGNNNVDEETEACRILRMDKYNTSSKVSGAWLHWTMDYWQSFVNHFNSIGVQSIASGFGALSGDIHYEDWMTLDEKYSCDCKHFSREGHKYNFVILDYAIRNNLKYIDLKYILEKGPKYIQPSLKK